MLHNFLYQDSRCQIHTSRQHFRHHYTLHGLLHFHQGREHERVILKWAWKKYDLSEEEETNDTLDNRVLCRRLDWEEY